MKRKKLYHYETDDMDFILYKHPNRKTRKFSAEANNKIIAYFDTEDKARLYADAFEKGYDYGYGD